ncbi:MAG TPA: DNA-binding response regulator, partial [Firmicutes bacterium]|nr:DNA-binding response regulator [Bacillota bacterium]
MYKILVTDDEDRIRELIKKYAMFEGYTVVEAENGMEAVNICQKESFDVIV